MSPTKATNRRTTARVVLAIVTSAMVLLVLFGSGSVVSFAQQAQQTTPSGTPPCRGAQIEWLNPSGSTNPSTGSGGPGTEMSNKQESAGSAGSATNGYHLVAWVSGAPDNATVEFKYQSGSDPDVTITNSATKVGTDTYEFYWDLAGAPEQSASGAATSGSTVTLKAILYGSTGGTPQECDRDTQTATVNNADNQGTPPDPRLEAQGETVEIMYPTNAGPWGAYKSVGIIDVRYSGGATYLTGAYTLSAPGTEPSWKSCGSSEATGPATGRTNQEIKCTLASGDTPEKVTAVAVIANDTDTSFGSPQAQFNDSGDAHRVAGYTQVPTTVATSTTSNQVAAESSGFFKCSPVITALVTDQLGRKVSGANVDVHAQGPTDDLFFDDSGDNSSAHQAPDKAHAQKEKAVNCEDTAVPPGFGADNTQGDHDLPGNDIKHIESTTGTGDDGTFKFQLNNRSTTAGTTTILVFADNDDNDQFCSSEPSAVTSIGWGGAPSQGSAPTEPEACPSPTGTATTSSPSPTPSSPSPTNTSASPTPTNTSPSPTPTPDTFTHPTTLTINYDGNSFDGSAKSSNAECRDGRRIVLKKKRPGRDKKVGSDTTNPQGRYSILERGARGVYYTVALKKTFTDGNGDFNICSKDRSPNERVRR